MLTLTDLQNVLSFVTRRETPGSFYREHYGLEPDEGPLTISSLKEWRALPVITKEDLSRVSLRERSYAPLSQIDYIGVSSGTSGRTLVFNPRSDVHNIDYIFDAHDFKRATLSYLVPIMPHLLETLLSEHGRVAKVIVFDPANPSASVRLARIAGVDSITAFAHQMQSIGDAMKNEGMEKDIRYIEITGGNCSHALYTYMREVFPNAKLYISYGAQEIDDAPSVGMPCTPMNGTDPLAVYHPKNSHFLEILDAETGTVLEPKAGVEGELLITAYRGEGAVFPVIRMRIGDRIRVLEERCPHGSWSFTILGRADMDFVKVPGGMLRVDEVSRVLRLFPERVSDLFELHCYTKETPRGPLIEPVLAVEARGETDLDELARDVAENLRTGPSHTYAMGTAEGRYLPLRCVPLEKSSALQKHKWLIQH